MSKIFQLEGGQYEHPNEYKLVSTVRGTTILQPEFGTVIIEGDVIEASTHNTIQKNGVLASKVNVTMESTATVLVPTDMAIESDLFNELKIMLLFETGTTLPSNSFIKLKETNVPIANVNDYIVNANTPLLFLYFDSKFYAYKAGEGASTGAESLGDLSDVTLTTPTNGQTLVYNGSKFVNKTVEEPASKLDDLSDVIVTTPTSGQTLVYNGSKFVNKTVEEPASKLDDLSDVIVTTPTSGQALVYNGTNFVNQNIVINTQATETINGTSKIATQTEVDNGLEDTKIVTSKKLEVRLDSMLVGIGTTFDSLLAGITSTYVQLTQLATESIAGIVKISTTAQVSAGTDNTTAVSPYKLKELFTSGASKTENGYQKLPSGVIVQWGVVADKPAGANVTFPVAFPTDCVNIQITRGGGTGSTGSSGSGASVIIDLSKVGFSFDSVVQSSDDSVVCFLAIGY